MPRFSELLNNHPLVGALPENVCDPLLSNIKETVRMHGTILYKEGSRPTGIWLVSVGVVKVRNDNFLHTGSHTIQEDISVYSFSLFATHFYCIDQWTSQRLSSKHSLDPILSHGSTLGLYEVLVGKPYICEMVTDSVVHCFFVEAEKIEELRQSDPSIEFFLWQVTVYNAAYFISLIRSLCMIA
jgi:CRP-like cAMP-binding protein